MKHILVIVAVLAATSFVYAKLPRAYFCAYDDFLEVHRAAFEDTQEPKRVFTTTHFSSYKYRPLNRGINLITYWAGSGSPTEFRARNVICHLVNVVLIYLFAWLLFRSSLTAGTAALLFGLHPLANHAVVGAVMTNTAAHSLFLMSLVLFIISTRKGGFSAYLLMALALFCGWLGLLTYESAIVVYPLMFAYLGIQFLATRNWPVSRAYTIALTLGCFLVLGVYYLIHKLYVPYSAKNAIPRLAIMLKGAVMYIGALLVPIDPVLANTWFGTPLPSDININSSSTITRFLVLLCLLAGILLVWLLIKFARKRLVTPSWPFQLFVASCAAAAILLLIVFTDKPSETYMYLPVAFAAVLFSSVLVQVLIPQASSRRRLILAVLVGMLAVSYGAATWVRNTRVARCGETAKQIVNSLQQDRFKTGLWFIWLAPAAGEPGSHRYGMYGWRGLDTVGYTAVEAAAQLVNRNESLAARELTPDELANGCKNSRDACFVVHTDGKVDEVDHLSKR